MREGKRAERGAASGRVKWGRGVPEEVEVLEGDEELGGARVGPAAREGHKVLLDAPGTTARQNAA